MIRGPVINAELNHLLTLMGQGDFLIVCDAGFPIPLDAWRIDLAVVRDVPNHETVLAAIKTAMVVEKVAYAPELTINNPRLAELVREMFNDADHEELDDEEAVRSLASQAKGIVRTGAFSPYGNILLYAGIDVPYWFDKPGVVIPAHYQRRLRQMGAIPDAPEPDDSE